MKELINKIKTMKPMMLFVIAFFIVAVIASLLGYGGG